jgi:hypothetical protein
VKSLILFLLSFSPLIALAQQRPDTTFLFTIDEPKYEPQKGPSICIDSAHNNYHTKDGGFAPFVKVVMRDGYKVSDVDAQIDSTSLSTCELFIIVNPLHESNIQNWVLPNPSAFSEDEIEQLNAWVQKGGSLFLIADHMPFAGAADELARSFGFNFSNGFATLEKESNQPDIFSLGNGRLLKSPVSGDDITTITSFTGSAFTYPENAIPVMVFKKGDFSVEPEVAWQFQSQTDTLEIEGFAQGALLNYGSGKVAVFGEAAMFTAQIIESEQGAFRIGINNKRIAPQNLHFILNVIHWLDE